MLLWKQRWMKSAGCSEDGSDQSESAKAKGIHVDAFSDKERLRKERRHRAVVLVGVVGPVRPELDPAIVEVEVRRVLEPAIGLRIIAFARPWHRKSRLCLFFLNFIRQQPITDLGHLR